MLKNCSNCDHCFAKMNGNIFCELDGMAIKDPYEEVDCDEHTLVGKDVDEKLNEKLESIANQLVDLYVQVQALINREPTEEVELPFEEEDKEPEWVKANVKPNVPTRVDLDDDTLESIIRKLLS